jgi:hypothetical protein
VAREEGTNVAGCEACGNECPAGAGFCADCGHRLGEKPAEPITVNVRLVDSPFRGFLSCFTTVVAVVVLVAFALWLFSC